MCTIQVTSVTATGIGSPTTLTVLGTASGCTEVSVLIDCSGGVATQTVPVNAGAWTAVFDAASGLPIECTCQGGIRVRANAIDDGTGGACQDTFSGIVDCTPRECPPNVVATASVAPGCNTDGTRTVTLFSFHDDPAPRQAKWDLGATFLMTGPLVPHTETHDYAPGAHTATLSVEGCPPKNVAFNVGPCPCPVLVSAAPNPEDCDGGLMDVALNVTNNGAAALACEWDFGDGTSSGSFTVAGVSTQTKFHEYLPGSHTATVAIVGCPAQSITFNVPPCPPPPPGPGTGTTTDDGSFCGLFCAIWVVLLAGYLVGIATGLLANPTVLAAATAILVAFTGFYIAFCGVCSYATCTLIALGLFLLAVFLMVILGVALPGLVPALIAAAGFLIGAILVRALAC